jgi:hypothetical protein
VKVNLRLEQSFLQSDSANASYATIAPFELTQLARSANDNLIEFFMVLSPKLNLTIYTHYKVLD